MFILRLSSLGIVKKDRRVRAILMAGIGISWVVLGGKPTVEATVVLVGFGVVEKVMFFHF